MYYEVPDFILSWLYLDKPESVIRSYTCSELLLKSGKEDESPTLDSQKHKYKYSRLSKEFEERVKQEINLTQNRQILDQKYTESEIDKDQKQQIMYFRDLTRLYLKLPEYDTPEPSQEEAKDKNSSDYENQISESTQDQYLIAKDYILY